MFTLPKLPFGYTDLEPFIDEATVHVHYDKHHHAYLNKLNAAIEGTDTAGESLDDIIKKANALPQAVKNNGGGVWNHAFYWECLGKGKNTPSEAMKSVIEKSFGSWEKFQEDFNAAGAGLFGSGWVWLEKMEDGTLSITTTANQDNPMNDRNDAHLVMTCDVWEHAYYLKYKNARPEYLKNFWEVINWKAVERFYETPYTYGETVA